MRLLPISMASVAQRGSLNHNQPRHPPLTRLVGSLRPARQNAPISRLHSFFRTISCSMRRYSERSATNFFTFHRAAAVTPTARSPYPRILSLPGLEGLFADPQLSADLRGLLSAFRLPERLQLLLLGVPLPRHLRSSWSV